MVMLGYLLIATAVLFALLQLRRLRWRDGRALDNWAAVVLLVALLGFVIWLILVLLVGTSARTF